MKETPKSPPRPKNLAAKALADPATRQRVTKPKRGKGAYTRKRRKLDADGAGRDTD